MLGFEALLRLPQAPELSGPEEAFDIAQHMGRSRDLDLLCAGHALDAARELPSDLKIFINLDPATLMHVDFSPHELLTMVTERGIDPAKVVFEITEKTTVPLTRLASQITGIQSCGFAMALDDVGSGNSGLEMMRVMKFDYVKIDRSVILDAMNGGPGRAIILAIVAFARESGAFMIAEGIENQAMLESIQVRCGRSQPILGPGCAGLHVRQASPLDDRCWGQCWRGRCRSGLVAYRGRQRVWRSQTA